MRPFYKLTNGFISFVKATTKFLPTLIKDFKKLSNNWQLLSVTMFMLVTGITAFIMAWNDMSGVQRAVTILATLATTLTAVAIAFHATHNWAKALMVGGMVAGGTLLVSSALTPKEFADGGMPDKGTLFIAGEAGAEIVTNSPNGQTGVTNVQQIQQAMYNALVAYGKTQGSNGQAIEVYLDGEKVYQNTTAHAKRRGKVWSNA